MYNYLLSTWNRIKHSIGSLCLIAATSLLATTSLAEELIDPSNGATIKSATDHPNFLYHWTTYEALKAIARGKYADDQWTDFRKTTSQNQALQIWPELDRPGGVLFGWSDPVTGMAFSAQYETYGTVPVRLELKPDAKVLELSEVYTPRPGDSSASHAYYRKKHDFRKYDVVLRRTPTIREWIILRPSAIVNFTADPDLLRDELLSASGRSELNDKALKILHSDLFNPFAKASDKNYVEKIVGNYLSAGKAEIPAFFLKEATELRRRANEKRNEAPTPPDRSVYEDILSRYKKSAKERVDQLAQKEPFYAADLLEEIQAKRQFHYINNLELKEPYTLIRFNLDHFLKGDETKVARYLNVTTANVATVRMSIHDGNPTESAKALRDLYEFSAPRFNHAFTMEHLKTVPIASELLRSQITSQSGSELSNIFEEMKVKDLVDRQAEEALANEKAAKSASKSQHKIRGSSTKKKGNTCAKLYSDF